MKDLAFYSWKKIWILMLLGENDLDMKSWEFETDFLDILFQLELIIYVQARSTGVNLLSTRNKDIFFIIFQIWPLAGICRIAPCWKQMRILDVARMKMKKIVAVKAPVRMVINTVEKKFISPNTVSGVWIFLFEELELAVRIWWCWTESTVEWRWAILFCSCAIFLFCALIDFLRWWGRSEKLW